MPNFFKSSQNWGCRGQSPLLGLRGVPAQTFFTSFMRHPELLKQKFQKQGSRGRQPPGGGLGCLSTVGFLEVQEAPPPAGVGGVPKSSLSSFSPPAAANKKGKRSCAGTPRTLQRGGCPFEPRYGSGPPKNLLLRGLGCPQILLFLLLRSAADGTQQERKGAFEGAVFRNKAEVARLR